jgi:hypothetical protein
LMAEKTWGYWEIAACQIYIDGPSITKEHVYIHVHSKENLEYLHWEDKCVVHTHVEADQSFVNRARRAFVSHFRKACETNHTFGVCVTACREAERFQTCRVDCVVLIEERQIKCGRAY